MKPILSVFIGTNKLGTIVDTGKCFVITDSTASCDKCKLVIVEDKVVDEKLRHLSSDEYIIFTDKQVYYNNKVYKCYTDIPPSCQYKAMFIVKEEDIVEFDTCKYDTPFINRGYAKAVKEADYVLLAKELPEGYTPGDLLVKKKDGSLVACTGRKYSVSDVQLSDDKYIILDKVPSGTGTPVDIPFSYTPDSLLERTKILNYHLQDYGRRQIESARIAMVSLSERLSQVNDYFKASSIYDDIHNIVKKIRSM